jgi:hypothetical protein
MLGVSFRGLDQLTLIPWYLGTEDWINEASPARAFNESRLPNLMTGFQRRVREEFMLVQKEDFSGRKTPKVVIKGRQLRYGK